MKENNIKNWKVPNITLALSLAIPALIISFNINAATPESINTRFPDVKFPDNCNSSGSGQCKIYTGTEPLDKLDNSSPNINPPVDKSFGYAATDGKGNNNTVIIKTVGDIKGIIRGISTNEDVGASFQGNEVYMDLNNKSDKPLILTDHSRFGPWGGGISAASAKFGKELINNNVFIKNSALLSDIMITGANAVYASLSGGADPFQDSKINNNSVVIDSSIISDTPSHDAVTDGATIAGAYLFLPADSSTTNSIDMSENALYIRNSTLTVDAMAAAMTYNLSGANKFTAYNNVAYIEGSHINTGDKIANRIYAAMGYDVQNNDLFITNSTFNINTLKRSYAISSAYYVQELAAHNSLVITNTTINTLDENTPDAKGVIISGAWSKDTVKNNAVYLDQVKLGKAAILINGGSTDASGKSGIADSNSVILKNTDLHDRISVMGGYVQPSKTDTAKNSSASGNAILIEGSHLAGNIYGGMLGSIDKPRNGQAENNTITIGSGQSGIFNALYGGFGANTDDTYKGNTLNLYSNISTMALGGFQHYNFYYNDLSQLDTAMIQVNGGNASSLYTTRKPEDNSTVTIMTKGLDITGGTKFRLFKNTTGFIDADTGKNLTEEDLKNIGSGMAPEIANFKSLATVEKFSPLEDYRLEISDDTLSAIINQPAPDVPNKDVRNDQTDILSTTSLATMATLTASDELLVDTVLTGSENRKKEGAFAAIRYGDYKYNSQNKLRTEQVSALFGYGFHNPAISYGVFLETGRNHYKSHTGSTFGNVYGNGNQNYGGTGVYLDYSTPVKGLHTTSYLKGGAIYDDFSSYIAMTDLDISETSAYWGAHAGLYWDVPVTQNWDGKLFANYFYDGREKKQSRVSDAKITYSELDSHRVQTGLLATYTGSQNIRPYIGLSWEEMMNAKANVSINDSQHHWNTNTADINGGTAIINTGINYIDPDRNMEAGVNIKGYNGMRNGVAAQIQVKLSF